MNNKWQDSAEKTQIKRKLVNDFKALIEQEERDKYIEFWSDDCWSDPDWDCT